MRFAKLLLAALLVLGIAGMAQAEELKIEGSTTVTPIIEHAMGIYMAAHPDVKIVLSGTGSGDGIKALIEGHINIAMASRLIKDKEVKMAEENGISPVEHVIAGDALTAVVHPSNPVSGLTVQQLQDIYSGKVTNWSEVGGPDMPIAVHSRESSSGTYGSWNGKILGKGEDAPRLTPDAQTVSSNGAMAAAVANNPNAIGYVGLGFVDETVKALAVDGVEATPANVANQSYILGRTLQLYTNGEPTGTVKDFIDWLMTDEGQESVVAGGFFSL